MWKRRLFLSNFTGLCNRLESLPLAFAIEEAYGHQVCLDWPELDCLQVEGTIRAKRRFWRRPGSTKVRYCDQAQFDSLGNYDTIILRGWMLRGICSIPGTSSLPNGCG